MSNGGPAFPTTEQNGVNYGESGMTLRDYFATQALAAMISKDNKEGTLCGASGVERLALFAYEYADSMIKAREQA